MDTRTTEPPRIERLRRELIAAIPRIPNNRASLRHVEQKGLAGLLIDYFNWRSRYVGKRPRKISIEALAQQDPRWSENHAIQAFLDKVRRGDDLTPHLSLRPHTRGYAPAAGKPNSTAEEKWSDKDFLLNVMGYHHFHIEAGPRGLSNDLIFARVSRDEFKVIAIFGHAVFENTLERERLWAVHDAVAFRGLPPGSVVVTGLIAISGHCIHVVRHAQICARWIRDVDPKPDDPDFVRTRYQSIGEPPAKSKMEWALNHLDLIVRDKATGYSFSVQSGWN